MKRNSDYNHRLFLTPKRVMAQGRCALREFAGSSRGLISAFCFRHHRRKGKKDLLWRQVFADRLGGSSGAGVAVVPARRIGIHIWRTDYWRKPLTNR
jgi:hypothetical protein